MYPRAFDYLAPSRIEDALDALAANPGAKVLAGGLSLVPLMKMRLLSPEVVIDISRIPGLDRIDERDDHVAIGALVRHAQTASSDTIRAHATALAEAAATTGDPLVRNRGTTCGSFAHADIAADQPAGALALGATMVVRSLRGQREVPAEDFFVDTLTTALEPDELLVEVRLPKRAEGSASAYEKLGRRGGTSDYAVAGAAAWVRRSNGTIEDARVAITGVGTRSAIAAGVAESLIGSDGSEDAIAAAARRAAEGVTVLEDLYGSEDYKRHLAEVYVARAVSSALRRV